MSLPKNIKILKILFEKYGDDPLALQKALDNTVLNH